MEKRKPGQFRDMEIKNLKPEEKEYWRREGQGFSIRVLPSGEKLWYYIYTFEGKKRQMRLGEGNYPDVSIATAREAFEAAKKRVSNGFDPLAEKERAALERKQTPTVADFVGEYIDDCKTRMKTWKDVERALKVEIVPRWGKRKITDITDRDIILVRDEIKARGAVVMANRVLTYISMMFAYAADQRTIKSNPYSHIKKAKKEKAKERYLSADEIKQLWIALASDKVLMSHETKKILKLILLTAQRPGEVAGMHSKELDGSWWTIPGSRTKNGNTHRVYLTDTALDIIGDVEGYIFPAGRGKEGGISVNALSFAIRRNIKGQSVRTDKVKRRKGEAYKRGAYSSKPLPENPNRIEVDFFTPHDLRRTAATIMASEKVPYEVREKVLNHTLSKMDGTYNQHDFNDDKIMAMEVIERKVVSAISGIKSKVIGIQQGRMKTANA